MLSKQLSPHIKPSEVLKLCANVTRNSLFYDYNDVISRNYNTPPKAPPKKGPAPIARKQPPPPMTKAERLARPTRKTPLAPDRKSFGDNLLGIQTIAAILTTMNQVDCKNWVDLEQAQQNDIKSKHGVKIGYFAAFCKATIDAIKKFTIVNAFVEEKQFVYRNYIDMTIPTITSNGVLNPVIKNIESMNCVQIQKVLTSIEESAAKNSIDKDILTDGTFTICDAGQFESMLGTNTLNNKQGVALSVHVPRDAPIAIKKKVEIRPMAYVGLTYDHRIIDGREAVLFLKEVKHAIENPENILKGL